MTRDALSRTEIKRRSLSGAKWLILTNIFGTPAAYVIVFILGRTGPEALGAYALAQIFIGVITTFAMFGGPTVLRNFMPKVDNAAGRGRFLFSYSIILTGLMLAILLLFYMMPGLLEFLLQREFNRENFGWFTLLTVVVVASECLMGAAAGLMHIKLAALARLMARIVILPLIAYLFFFNRPFLLSNTVEAILAGFLISYGMGAALCIVGIARDKRFHLELGWSLPKGFGAFAWTSTAAAVFSFFYANFDRICVLGLSDLAGLGMYQAVLSLMMLVEYVPNMLQTAVVPVFSGLQGDEQRPALERVFGYLCRNTVLLVTSASLVMMAFSREILELLGEGYGEYDYLLAMYCFVSVVRSPAFPSLAVLISAERNHFRLAQSVAQLIAQTAITLLFIQNHGVLAIAGAKMLAGSISTLAGILYVVYGLKMAPGLARSYRVGLAIGFVVLVLRIGVVPPGWLGSTLLSLCALGALVVGSRLSWDEIQGFLRVMTTRDINISTGSGSKDFDTAAPARKG